MRIPHAPDTGDTKFSREGVVNPRFFCQHLSIMLTAQRSTAASAPFAPQRPAIVAKFRGALTLPCRPERFALFGSQAVAIW